jgi:hypothetical protein
MPASVLAGGIVAVPGMAGNLLARSLLARGKFCFSLNETTWHHCAKLMAEVGLKRVRA